MALRLAEVLADLRDEVAVSMAAADGESLQFELGPIELELTVAVEKEAKPGAKVKFWVLELGTDARLAATNTQKLKIKLTPRDGERGGRAPMVSGESLAGER